VFTANIDGAGYNISNLNTLATTTLVSSTGNVVGGNILTGGLISATAGITGNTLTAGGFTLTGNTITSAGPTITIDPNGSGGIDGNVIIAGNLSVQGNVTYIDSNVITTNEKSITLANNATTSSQADGSGIDVGNTTIAYWRFNNATTSWQSNIAITPAANATLNLGGTSNYWANLYATGATVSGNVTAGNLLTPGLVSTVGNVYVGASNAGYVYGNAYFMSGISAAVSVSKITNGSSYANISASNGNLVVAIGASANVVATFYDTGVNVTGPVSATGNVTGGNLTTAGLITATGNVTGGNLVTGGLITATGNVTGGNVITAGQVSAVGNVSVGNASAVRWANATGVRAYTYYNNATGSLDTVFI
jgi:hypothetical protein